ncbi:MAG: hypothetical protein WCF61_01145, partial [Terriglobales bacterium]
VAQRFSAAVTAFAQHAASQIAEKLGFVSGYRFSDTASRLKSDAPLGAGHRNSTFSANSLAAEVTLSASELVFSQLVSRHCQWAVPTTSIFMMSADEADGTAWEVSAPLDPATLFIAAGFVTNRSEQLHSGDLRFCRSVAAGADPFRLPE